MPTDDDALVGLSTQADELGRNILATSVNLRPRLEQITNRLAEIGDPPKDGQPPEAQIVTDERNALMAERSQINAVTGDAENLSLGVNKLMNEVAETRRRLFAATLLRRTEVSASVFGDAGKAFVEEVGKFQEALSSWLTFAWKFKRFALFAAIFMSLGTGLILLSGGYRMFGRYLRRDEGVENPSYISRLSIAFWSTLIRTLALVAVLVTSYFFLNGFNVLRPDIAPGRRRPFRGNRTYLFRRPLYQCRLCSARAQLASRAAIEPRCAIDRLHASWQWRSSMLSTISSAPSARQWARRWF